MKRLLALLAGIAGLAWWRKRSTPAPQPQPHPQPDPADELRAKLAQARDADDRDEFEAGEQAVDEIDVRRQDVHGRARAAMDDLQSGE